MESRNLYKVAIEGFVLIVCVLLFCSCISFDISDAPSAYVWPTNEPVANWCGVWGAYPAYHLMYYVGPGVFILLAAVAAIVFCDLIGVKITQPILRGIGLVLLVAAFSSTWYLLCPVKEFWPYSGGTFPIGSGGVLGIAIADFLISKIAVLGMFIVMAGVWVVGAVLLADSLVLAAIRLIGAGFMKLFGVAVPTFSAATKHSKKLGEIWQRLNEKQSQWRLSRQEAQDAIIEKDEPEDEDEYEYEYEYEEVEEEEEEEDTGKAVKPKLKITMPKTRKPKPYIPKSYEDYRLPPLELLKEPEYSFAAIQEKMVEKKAHALESLLMEFGINAHVVNAEPGPAITMYELELSAGVKVSQISSLSNDIARALSAGSVRVVAPLPGRHTIGIEVPNSQREIVRIRDLIQRAGDKPGKMYIPIFLGKSSSGEVLSPDLAIMPHLLIAGTTGSGKSVCINSIIASILLTRRPDEVKMVLIDPKMVEMAIFESIPHLMCPIVTDTKRAEQILSWATTKMDERYELLSEAKVRNIASYNKLGAEEIIKRFQPSTPEEEAKIPKKMPHIVIVIDELADLMMTAAKEIEAYIVRLAQKSRAVGIHLIVATQRPQATVVTGLIKSNMPARISFRVASRMDSRIILDQNGGETLLGQGDMLFLRPGTSDLVRAQGAFMDDIEARLIVRHLKDVAVPQYHPELMQLNKVDISDLVQDELYDEAVKVVLETKRGSVSLLQRRLGIGYARSSRIIEMMAAAGLLGEYKGSQAREVTMTFAEYEQAKQDADIEAAEYESAGPDIDDQRGDDYDQPVENQEDDEYDEEEEYDDDEEYEEEE